MLSRNIMEGANIMSSLCPYAATALFVADSLGVSSPLEYVPYAYWLWLCWALGILLPMFGLTIVTKEKVEARSKKHKQAQ